MDIIKKFEPLFGEWYVDSFIGAGSYGRVYKIYREEFGEKFYSALKYIPIPNDAEEMKQLRMEGMDDESISTYYTDMARGIAAETRLMNKLRGNTNIVSFEDSKVFEKPDGVGYDIFIRMELLQDLPGRILEKPLTRQEIIKLGTDICNALARCNKNGIIHRDIKPDNIFVSKDGDFKLGDFGIARQLEKTATFMSKKGTYNYMAPEVYRGEKYGASCDIYSLGIVLYRLLNNGRLPFLPPAPQRITPDDKEKSLVRRMMGDPMPLPCDAQDMLGRVVLKACAFRPEDRYAKAEDLRADLNRCLEAGSSAPSVQRTPQNYSYEPTPSAQTPVMPKTPAYDATVASGNAYAPQAPAYNQVNRNTPQAPAYNRPANQNAYAPQAPAYNQVNGNAPQAPAYNRPANQNAYAPQAPAYNNRANGNVLQTPQPVVQPKADYERTPSAPQPVIERAPADETSIVPPAFKAERTPSAENAYSPAADMNAPMNNDTPAYTGQDTAIPEKKVKNKKIGIIVCVAAAAAVALAVGLIIALSGKGKKANKSEAVDMTVDNLVGSYNTEVDFSGYFEEYMESETDIDFSFSNLMLPVKLTINSDGTYFTGVSEVDTNKLIDAAVVQMKPTVISYLKKIISESTGTPESDITDEMVESQVKLAGYDSVDALMEELKKEINTDEIANSATTSGHYEIRDGRLMTDLFASNLDEDTCTYELYSDKLVISAPAGTDTKGVFPIEFKRD
ncbi:MAG: protein kinase [Clostridia bacterium]|nr:protein kinase [Clostridia bacterium]